MYEVNKIYASLMYETNRFHVAVRLFVNRSQRTSKCGEDITYTLGYHLIHHCFCSYCILNSSVIDYSTYAMWQCGIYLFETDSARSSGAKITV